MTRLRHLRAALACAGLPLFAAATSSAAHAGTLRVTINTPVPARIDMTGMHRLLTTRFLVDKEVAEIDLNRELVSLLRREVRKKTDLDVLDVEPPPLPEQPFRELLANTGFWRRLAETNSADLVISGKVSFEVSDRSGFVQQDEISPLTGQRVRRTRFIEREGFTLDLSLFFIRGRTGQIAYEDHFTAENVLNGRGTDRLTALFALFEQFEDDILGIMVPKSQAVQRFLLTE